MAHPTPTRLARRRRSATLAPYVPGKPLEELEREYGISDSIKLASNENPLGPGPRALAAMREGARGDRSVSGRQRLRAEAGARAQARLRRSSSITLGNGSNDVLVHARAKRS